MKKSEEREHLFRLLFCEDFREGEELGEQADLYRELREAIPEEEFLPVKEKFNNIVNKRKEIDSKIESFSQGWALNRIGKAELTILRIAVYELLFDEEVPGKVAINEAVELAKKYGSDSAPSYVNGILAGVIKEKENLAK
ncbi:MAG: transcription antitermination factor NusB [Lachnospiraceae bacterium]|nr:transcription antitermination factor NusB [Lachnospiraceae bacterium]